MTHPSWCGPACDAGQPGGRHKGLVTPVGDPRRPLATVYVELVDGKVRVCLAAGLRQSWTPEDAMRVAAVLAEVAVEAERLDVRV